MLVLITYDVNTESTSGKNSLRKVAKQLRIMEGVYKNSVFECIMDQSQSIMLKSILTDIIDESVDSLRFYYLGNNYKQRWNILEWNVELQSTSL